MFKWLSVAFLLVLAVPLGLSLLGAPLALPLPEEDRGVGSEFLGNVASFAQERKILTEDGNERIITEQEIQLYIDVYKAMQSDHSLKIEDAVATRGISVTDFRAIERGIQNKTLLVERVRAALLEHAKQQPVLALHEPPARSTPELTPAVEPEEGEQGQ